MPKEDNYFDYNSDDYVTTKIDNDTYLTQRIKPFTEAEERALKRQTERLKNGLKVNISEAESPEEAAKKVEKAIK